MANNRTLEGIASRRPADRAALAEIHGVGPAFIERHADAALELVAAVNSVQLTVQPGQLRSGSPSHRARRRSGLAGV